MVLLIGFEAQSVSDRKCLISMLLFPIICKSYGNVFKACGFPQAIDAARFNTVIVGVAAYTFHLMMKNKMRAY